MKYLPLAILLLATPAPAGDFYPSMWSRQTPSEVTPQRKIVSINVTMKREHRPKVKR